MWYKVFGVKHDDTEIKIGETNNREDAYYILVRFTSQTGYSMPYKYVYVVEPTTVSWWEQFKIYLRNIVKRVRH